MTQPEAHEDSRDSGSLTGRCACTLGEPFDTGATSSKGQFLSIGLTVPRMFFVMVFESVEADDPEPTAAGLTKAVSDIFVLLTIIHIPTLNVERTAIVPINIIDGGPFEMLSERCGYEVLVDRVSAITIMLPQVICRFPFTGHRHLLVGIVSGLPRQLLSPDDLRMVASVVAHRGWPSCMVTVSDSQPLRHKVINLAFARCINVRYFTCRSIPNSFSSTFGTSKGSRFVIACGRHT
jgi:hypothetical protein